ncbi:hypothetical protein CAEBREN_14552 [Caenorhabditis brenneri]|uniref:Ubiquitin-like protease family profile domain-containing protein n=1 Tax=Caenorhabditis brenneri TaxID=135651 RepID=G0MH54_CAEBE|nr:hypothetical protein CAEBREN_14552 [Caenorhabditis brenneri]
MPPKRKQATKDEDSDGDDSPPQKMNSGKTMKTPTQYPPRLMDPFLKEFYSHPDLSWSYVKELSSRFGLEDCSVDAMTHHLKNKMKKGGDAGIWRRSEEIRLKRELEVLARRMMKAPPHTKSFTKKQHLLLEEAYQKKKTTKTDFDVCISDLKLSKTKTGQWLQKREATEKQGLQNFKQFLEDPNFSFKSTAPPRTKMDAWKVPILEEDHLKCGHGNSSDQLVMRKLQKKTGESDESIRRWKSNRRNRIRRRGVKQSEEENDRSPSPASNSSIMNSEVGEESKDLTNLKIDQNSDDGIVNVDASLALKNCSLLDGTRNTGTTDDSVHETNVDYEFDMSDVDNGVENIENNVNQSDVLNDEIPPVIKPTQVVARINHEKGYIFHLVEHLTLQNISTLQGTNLIDSEIIDFASLSNIFDFPNPEKFHSALFLPARFFDTLIEGVDLKKLVEHGIGLEVLKWNCTHHMFGVVDIFYRDVVIVPIGTGAHYVLAVIVKGCQVYVFDSNRFVGGEETNIYFTKAVGIILTEYMDLVCRHLRLDPTELPPLVVQYVENVPQQMVASNDCAIFVIFYMKTVMLTMESWIEWSKASFFFEIYLFSRISKLAEFFFEDQKIPYEITTSFLQNGEQLDWSSIVPEELRDVIPDRVSVFRQIMKYSDEEQQKAVSSLQLGFPMPTNEQVSVTRNSESSNLSSDQIKPSEELKSVTHQQNDNESLHPSDSYGQPFISISALGVYVSNDEDDDYFLLDPPLEPPVGAQMSPDELDDLWDLVFS